LPERRLPRREEGSTTRSATSSVAPTACPTPKVMDRVARALGTEEAASGLHDLGKRIGAPTALKEIGMKEEELDEAVALVLEEAPRDNPRPVDEAGIRQLLEDAYAGRRPARGGGGGIQGVR
jgi:maleylacetate reductase